MQFVSRHILSALALMLIGSCSTETPVDPFATPAPGTGWDRRFAADNAPNNIVTAITTGGDLVYAGGKFTSVRKRGDDSVRRHLVAYTGAEWKSIAQSVVATSEFNEVTVDAIEIFNGDLFACGPFESIDGASVSEFAQWNGTQWKNASPIRVDDIAVSGPFMYVATDFGAAQIRYGQWSVFDTGLDPALMIKRIAAIDSSVFGQVGVEAFQWRNGRWAKVGTFGRTDGGTPILHDLIVINHELYAVGDFDRVYNSIFLKSYGIARYDGSTWQSVGDDGGEHEMVYALARDASGRLLAGRAGSLVRYSAANPGGPAGWETLGIVQRDGGVAGRIFAVAVHKGVVYIGGDFITVGSTTNRIASNYFGAFH